jgi:hypothetical protein
MKRGLSFGIFIFIISISLVSAVPNALDCSIKEKYYKDGAQILYINEDFLPDSISFDITCSNLDNTQRLISINITKTSPNVLYNNFPNKTIDFLRIYEKDKVLFSSKIIPMSSIENENNFSVSLISLSEKEYTYMLDTTSIIINIPEKENPLISFGKAISPSSPITPLIIIAVIILLFIWLNVRNRTK